MAIQKRARDAGEEAAVPTSKKAKTIDWAAQPLKQREAEKKFKVEVKAKKVAEKAAKSEEMKRKKKEKRGEKYRRETEKRLAKKTVKAGAAAFAGQPETANDLTAEAQRKKDEKNIKVERIMKDGGEEKEILDVVMADPDADEPASAPAETERPPEAKSKKEKEKQSRMEGTSRKEKSTDEVDQSATATDEPQAAELDVAKEDNVAKKEKKSTKNKKSKNKTANTDGPDITEMPSETAAPSSNGKYKQTASLSALPEWEIKTFLYEKEISILDEKNQSSTLRPIIHFHHLPYSALLAQDPFSFTAPTPIQAASWPFSLGGRDVVGIAETGSGKTLAFALPCVEALHRILGAKSTQKPDYKKAAEALAIIISPTRELAMQTYDTVAMLARRVGVSAVCVYGGASKEEQRNLLSKGADIVVATPGRLRDFLADRAISLAKACFVVMDEADRMLDRGFENDVRLILGLCPPGEQRQTLMFTATWPTSVRKLASTFMINPVHIAIGRKVPAGLDAGESGSGFIELQANSRIEQEVEVVDSCGKEQRLLQLVKAAQAGSHCADKVLVFCLYKKEAVRVEQLLRRKGIKVASIHGDLRQEQRTRSLEAFKAGTTTVLVATDVAARGLDIPNVKLVINVTFPLTIEDYVHRIGRTGRAGKEGKAITLFTEHDKAHSGSLINVLRGAKQKVPEDLLKFGTTVKKKAHDSYGAFFKNVDMTQKGSKITFD